MKKNSKKNRIIAILLVLIVAIIGIYYLLPSYKNENTLTLKENKWIDSNKYNVIDVALFSDVPIISYEGKGLAYDFLDYVSEKYSLTFNVASYKMSNSLEYDYKMNIVESVKPTDIELLKDNFVLIMANKIEYTSKSQINNFKLGVLSSEVDFIDNYFKNYNIEFVKYDTYDELKTAIVEAKDNTENDEDREIDGIIILKDLAMKELIEKDLRISYEFVNLNKYIVLETNGDVELNSILNKSYNNWVNKNYDTTYKTYLLDSYFKFNNVSDSGQKKLNSKSYVYGFIDYGVFNTLKKNKFSGLTSLILKDFNSFTGISISYQKYNSISKLKKGFVDGKVDFMLDFSSETSNDYEFDASITSGVFDKKISVISGVKNNIVASSIEELMEVEVLAIKDSSIEEYLINNGVKVKRYNNLNELVKDFKEDSIAVIDLENFNYYKTSYFKNSKINFIIDDHEVYSFIINNNEENSDFSKLFNFYLDFVSTKKLVATKYQQVAYKSINIVYILSLIIVILLIYLVLDLSNHVKSMFKRYKASRKTTLTKEEKIKYIDQLTSLKNRAYLNSKVEEWDNSEVYPQAIVIVDLNNVSYINDNYGREEGDKVITEAANILIMHQLQNSEVIRSDGNEFLIYLVGYTEKQIISYLRKLNKELKGLSHGFGAASGYSIINDAIKTIDDAVNEAVIDMKNNKEDIEY